MGADDLSVFRDYLDAVHARTRRVIVCIPRDAVEWRPAPTRWSPGDLVRHLAGIERWVYAETVEGRPTRYPGHDRALADGYPALIAYYDRLHEQARRVFTALTPAAFVGKSVTPAGAAITTWKWLRAMLEHEAHHRGQLYLLLGLLDAATPPLYGLTSEQLRAQSA
jgi:uncharacterized damage-inducible protein DinB